MSKEAPQPHDLFGFTERERLWDRISHSRFMVLVENEQTLVHKVELSSNMYGEFLFVTLSRSADQKRVSLTFYGAGFHEHRERWITDAWGWYETTLSGDTAKQAVAKEEAVTLIEERQAEIGYYANEKTQTKRGKLFEMLADLTDEDGALSEIEDLGDFDWFDDE